MADLYGWVVVRGGWQIFKFGWWRGGCKFINCKFRRPKNLDFTKIINKLTRILFYIDRDFFPHRMTNIRFFIFGITKTEMSTKTGLQR